MEGNTWFVLKDACDVLGIQNHKDIHRRMDEDEVGRFDLPHPQNPEKSINMTLVSESGLYTVILRSDKPKAKPFRKWVTKDVLPSIRKTGSYSINAHKISLLIEQGEQLKAEVEELRETIRSLPLLPVDADVISKEVRRVGVEMLGGKKPKAYSNASIRGKVYSDMYRQLTRQFGVKSYKQIQRNQRDQAFGMIVAYSLPMLLANHIEEANG